MLLSNAIFPVSLLAVCSLKRQTGRCAILFSFILSSSCFLCILFSFPCAIYQSVIIAGNIGRCQVHSRGCRAFIHKSWWDATSKSLCRWAHHQLRTKYKLVAYREDSVQVAGIDEEDGMNAKDFFDWKEVV